MALASDVMEVSAFDSLTLYAGLGFRTLELTKPLSFVCVIIV